MPPAEPLPARSTPMAEGSAPANRAAPDPTASGPIVPGPKALASTASGSAAPGRKAFGPAVPDSTVPGPAAPGSTPHGSTPSGPAAHGPATPDAAQPHAAPHDPVCDPPRDPWAPLRGTTRARIGLGRVGNAMPLHALLDFQLAHARARDAVHAPLDVALMQQALQPQTSFTVRSAAPDRAAYLRRPDLGRALDPACRDALDAARRPDGWDAVFVLADGLSPVAMQQHGAAMYQACLARLPGWAVAPPVIATQARVALGDTVAERLGARLCVVLIGERPGLSAANSLGAYLTWHPGVGHRDAERNCVSNIHADGLPIAAAAELLTWLMREATRRKLTGVGLRDDRATLDVTTAAPQIGPPSPSSSGVKP